MSKFTTEVRYICETTAGLDESKGYNSVNSIIEASANSIIGDYPIFDESYRGPLNAKILKHYYTREIGAETVGLWKLWLNTRMNEIMPYYNQLYKSALLEFNPLYDVDITTKHEGDKNVVNDGISANVGEGTFSNNMNKHNTTTNASDTSQRLADTPQGGLNGVVNDMYLTTAQLNKSNGVNTNTGSSNGGGSTHNKTDSTVHNNENTTEGYLEKVAGKTAGKSYSKLLSEYRETFLNIDMMVIEELGDLFFGLWD